MAMQELSRVYPFRREEGAKPTVSRLQQLLSDPLQLLQLLAMAAVFLCISRAQMLGALYPFAPALLAAAAATYGRPGIVAAVPLLLGLATVLPLADLFTYGAILLLLSMIFLLYRVDSRRQWLIMPSVVTATVLVSKGLVISLQAYSSYLLLISIFESLLAAGLTLVFMVGLQALRRFTLQRRFSSDEAVCLFIGAMACISGLSGVTVYGVELQSVMSRLLIIAVAFLGGAGAGAAAGAMIGIVPSLSTIMEPTLIATYAFSGLLSGVFAGFGRLGSAMGFILGNLILALYVMSAAELTAALLATLAASAIFFILPKRLYQLLARAFSVQGIKNTQEEKNERLLKMAVRRLRSSGWVFRDLGNALAEIAVEPESAAEDNLQLSLHQLNRQLCGQCSLRDICWRMDYAETYAGVLSLFDAVRDNGSATLKDAPENFVKRCPHIKELIAVVNCLYDNYCLSNFWQAQRQGSRMLLARQLAGVAEVMEHIAGEVSDFGEEREILERELQRALAQRGLPVDSAGMLGISSRGIDVWAQYRECPGELVCRHAVEDEVSRLLGCDFLVHEQNCGGQGCLERCRYRLLARGAYSISVGKAQLAAGQAGVCGDSGGSLLLDEGKQLLMISDGMGMGERAAQESEAALTLVSKLLEAGFMQDTAIDTVNAALSLRGTEESFVTLDLCIIDLFSGQADFIKTGASVSFIKRGRAVKVIRGSSLPVGMLYSIDKEVISEQILPGDMIVMASDGLLEGGVQDDAGWLARIIEQATANQPQALAEYLLDKVVALSRGQVRDDITVLVAQLGQIA